MREHEFDVNGSVMVHRPTCWCAWWEEAVRAAKARNRQARATDPVDDEDGEDEPWWKR